jgi:tetratricopeptide (TPR) repeat protein
MKIKMVSQFHHPFLVRTLFLFVFVVCLFAAPSLMAQVEHVGDSIPKKDPEINPSVLIDAKKMMLKGNLHDAEALIRQYIERYPKDAAANFELAKLLAARQAYEEALVYAEHAAALQPENLWYQVFWAETCQMVQRYDEAVKIYETIVATNPKNLDHFYKLASLYLGLGDLEKAIDIYDKIEQRTSLSEEISLQKQQIYLKMKAYKKAEAEIQRLIDAYPAESRYYGILAEYYMARDMKKEALEQYKKILEIDPDNAYIHMTLADYYRKEGDREKSYQELKKGFANPNLDVDTKVNILLSFYTINEMVSDLKDQAFELAKLLVETHPDDPKVYAIYGDLLSQDKQYLEARNAFQEVIAYDSSRYVIWEELLRMDLMIEDYEHLASNGKIVLELFPEQPVAYLFTALGAFQLEQYEEARTMLERGLKMVAGNSLLQAQFYMYLGDTYHTLNEDQKAYEAYEKSLKHNQDNAYVLNNYSYYLSLEGKDLEKARIMAEKAVSLEPDNSSFQDTYGWVLYKLGEYKEAKEWVGKALKDKVNVSGEVLEHYGDILFQLGETRSAVKFWKQAMEKGGGSVVLEQKIKKETLIEK